MKRLDILVSILVIIGGLNWGLVGLFEFNIVDYCFSKSWVENLIYVLIGFSAGYQLFGWKSMRKRWIRK